MRIVYTILGILTCIVIMTCVNKPDRDIPKTFLFKQRVKIVKGFYTGCNGIVEQHSKYDNMYNVTIDCNKYRLQNWFYPGELESL